MFPFVNRLGLMVRRRWRALAVLAVIALLVWAARSPLYAWYHLRAGAKALDRYQISEAQRHLDACLAIWPNSTTAHLLACRAARRARQFDEAERHREACERLEGSPSDAALLEWALLRACQGDLREVEEYLQTRVKKDAANAPLIFEALAEGYSR